MFGLGHNSERYPLSRNRLPGLSLSLSNGGTGGCLAAKLVRDGRLASARLSERRMNL